MQNISLAELRDDLFGLVASLYHLGPPLNRILIQQRSYGMTDQYLGPLVSGDEITSELKHQIRLYLFIVVLNYKY